MNLLSLAAGLSGADNEGMDVNMPAYKIAQQSMGEPHVKNKQPATATRGLKRAAALPPERYKEIVVKASRARWDKARKPESE